MIGEKMIDKHDGRFYDILNELNHTNNTGLPPKNDSKYIMSTYIHYGKN